MSLRRNPFYEDVVDQPPTIKLEARIAALEMQVARLTAPVTPDEAVAFTHDRHVTTASGGGNMGALTAFLERRIKG